MMFIRIGFLHSGNLTISVFSLSCCAHFVLSLVCFRCCAFMRNKSLHFNKRHLKVFYGIRGTTEIVFCCYFFQFEHDDYYYFFVQLPSLRAFSLPNILEHLFSISNSFAFCTMFFFLSLWGGCMLAICLLE